MIFDEFRQLIVLSFRMLCSRQRHNYIFRSAKHKLKVKVAQILSNNDTGES